MSGTSAQESVGGGGPPGAGGGASGSGSGSSSKVDAIWQQLKGAHAAPKSQAVNLNKLMHSFSSDPMQGVKRPAARAPQQPAHEAELIARPGGRAPTGSAEPQAQSSGAGAVAAAGSAKPDADTALQLVARCVAGLKDSSQAARRKALQDVRSSLLGNPALGEQWLAERLEDDGLGKALLRRFDDPADTSRELAATNLLGLLQAAPGAVLSLLPYAFPVVAERLAHKEEGSRNLTEPCEEVRLALARLLRSLVCLGAKSFGGYAGEAVALVGALCEDPFHEVQEEACAVVLALNDALGPRLHPIAKQLVASLLPLTTAKRHRVRVAALQALRPTMHQGAHEMILEMVAWRDPNVIAVKAFYGDDLKVNFCGKLASDPHPMVRREFLALLADWMTALRERLDHEARLLPYVLSALNDELPEIQADAVALLERLGVQYEADHEKDLKEMLPYLPEEAHGIGWQAAGAAGYMYGSAAAGEETVNGGRAVFVLPGPMRSRPRLGARRLVQSNFSRIVHPLSDEVTSWLLDARRRAAALLRTQLVLVEEWSEQHLHLVLPALCKAIGDPEVRAVVRDCCSVVGAFTDPELSLQLLQPRVADEGGDLAQRAAALEVLACVVRGAGPRRALDPHMAAVLDLMTLESLLGSEDSRIRRALHDLLEQLLATCGPACGRHAARLLWVCLHLRAPGRGALAQAPAAAAAAAAVAVGPGGGDGSAAAGEALGAAVEGVLMPRLAEVCGCSGGSDELVEAHRAELLQQVHPEASGNVFLAAGVLARLMLPYASRSHLLYLPEDLLARVLPPSPVDPGSAAPTATTTAPTAPSATGGPAPMEVEAAGAPPGGGGAAGTASASGRLHWQPASTAAVLGHLAADLGWLARQPRCATLCMVCLEACLDALPAADGRELPACGGEAAGGDAAAAGQGPGGLLAATLVQLLAALQELPAQALLAGLRCAHAALRRGLVPEAALAARLPELLQELAGCMAVVSGAACRLQACYVMQMLLGTPAAAACLAEEAGAAGGAGAGAGPGAGAGGLLQGVCSAIAGRLYDATDEVRCAALGLAREVVELTLRAGGARGAGEALVSEIAQLRDVAPGSAFYEAYGAFRGWAAVRLPQSAGVP